MNIKDRTILIVDNDKETRELINSVLQNDGFKTKTANNGNEAIELIKKHEYDLIILNMFLPQKTGYEVISSLQKMDYKRIPIIVTTGTYFQKPLTKFLELEPDIKECITKPINPNLLLLYVNEILHTVPANEQKLENKSIISEEKIFFDESETDLIDIWPILLVNNEKIRKDTRININIQSEIFSSDSKSYICKGLITDFSFGGIGIETETEIELNTNVNIKITYQSIKLDFCGMIVYRKRLINNKNKYGIRFTELDDIEKKKLFEDFYKLKQGNNL